MQLAQGDGAQVRVDAPSARMAFVRRDDARIPQVPHGAPDDDRMGAQALREGVGCHGALVLGHVQQRMQDGGQAAVAFHATNDVA